MPNPPQRLPDLAPVTFTIDGDEFTLPDLDTETWLSALVLQPPACWWRLIPGELADDDQQHIMQRLVTDDDPFDLDDIEHAAETVLGAVTGVGFHPAVRLAGSVQANWTAFDGWSYAHGTDPLTQPIHRVLNAAYHWRREMCEKKADVTRLDAEVWASPPSVTVTGKPRDPVPNGWDDDTEAAIFAQAMAQTGGGRG